MKKNILIIVAISFATFDIAICGKSVENKALEVPLDHFNLFDTRTFGLRYFVNGEFYIADGPIFIYISGGFETFDEFINRGVVYDLANETRGFVIALEHRYYGLSQPTENTSVSNLQFLTVHQALADIATFISFFKETGYETQHSRVILFGRGWGGRLAVWARQKYPNLVDGVWASSAPINAIPDFGEFLTNLGSTAFRVGGPECEDRIEGAFRSMDVDIWLESTTNFENRLRLCSPINPRSESDIAAFFFTMIVELGHFMKFATADQIVQKCATMTNPEIEDDFEGFARWFIDDLNRNMDCIEASYNSLVQRASNIEWNTIGTIGGRRQDLWLQCTQIGQFYTTSGATVPSFASRVPVEFFYNLCADIFGAELFQGSFAADSISQTNRLFGGLNPRTYRVFYTHGELDPIRSLGPLVSSTPLSPVAVIPNESFSRDFASISSNDSDELRQVKEQARLLMIEWIFQSIEEDKTT